MTFLEPAIQLMVHTIMHKWHLLALLAGASAFSPAKIKYTKTKITYHSLDKNKYSESESESESESDTETDVPSDGELSETTTPSDDEWSDDETEARDEAGQHNPGPFLYKSKPRFTKFTPQHDCTGTFVHFIDHTHGKIYVMAYAFTCPYIIRALRRAAKRGVKVRILVDRQYQSKPQIEPLKSEPTIKIYIDRTPAIAHNKIMIFSNKDVSKDIKQFDYAVITGSFNFSASAQKRNAENIDGTVNDLEKYTAHKGNWKYRKHLPLTIPIGALAYAPTQPKRIPKIQRRTTIKSNYKKYSTNRPRRTTCR